MIKACRAVIAEDEPVLRDQLRDMLSALWPELDICAETGNGIDTMRALQEHAPQVLFLDIQMPGMSGLDVARCASGRCHVVFVTAYDSYAVAAFDEGVVDYVLKPISTARIATMVQRLQEKLGTSPATLETLLRGLQAAQPREYLRWITVQHGDDLRLITVESVCYLQADNKYTRVVLPERESFIRWPIKKLIRDLDPKLFWQIHRGTIVNVNAVAGVTRDIKGNLRVTLNSRREMLTVSEPYVHLFNLL